MQLFQILLPIIPFAIGIVFTKLLDYFLDWQKRKEKKINDYRNFLKEYLKDYLAPLYEIIFKTGAELHSNIDSGTEMRLIEAYNALKPNFFDKIGIFAYILPFDILTSVSNLSRDLKAILNNLEDNKIDEEFISKTTNNAFNILDGLRKIFGIEHIEKLDKEFREYSQIIKKENTEE